MRFPRAVFVVAVALLFLGAALTQAQEKQEKKEAPVIALTGGTLIDGNGGAPVPDAVVLIQGKKILQAGPAAKVKVPEKAEKIDVRGKYILPGFIDCHIHTTYPFNEGEYFTDTDASTTLRALYLMNLYL
jgi:imidazolonepropionase-like amidohydrolase